MGRSRKYTLNEHVFDVIDTPEKAYWLGYLYCDGSTNTCQVELYSIDIDIIQKFHNFLETNRPIAPVVTKQLNGKFSKGFVQTVQSKHLVQILYQYGIIPNKTYDHSVSVYIPPEPLTSHFWRGCLDGDGSIGWSNHYCMYVTKTGEEKRYTYLYSFATFSNRNLSFLNKFRLFVELYTDRKVGTSEISPGNFEFNFGPTAPGIVLPFLDELYTNSLENIRMDRKYQKYLEIKGAMIG